MIATADGRDHLQEEGIKWDGIDGDHDLEDEEWNANKMSVLRKRVLRKLTDYSAIGRRHLIYQGNGEEIEIDSDFFSLSVSLINYYYY